MAQLVKGKVEALVFLGLQQELIDRRPQHRTGKLWQTTVLDKVVDNMRYLPLELP